MRMHNVVMACAVLLSAVASAAASDCPPAVAAAVQKAHAGVAIASCKQEKENGKTEFEVKLVATEGKRIELDVSPDGTILMTEQSVAVGDVPPAVMTAFAAKYGATAPARAEMQTSAEGKVTYELAFAAGAKKKEATFASDGSFVEEE
jgi:opacity protein-like surface antigen